MPRSAELALYGGQPVRQAPFPADKDIGEEELRLVEKVIRSKQLNRFQGHLTREFELRFAEHYGVAHCTASSSGTAAIHIALGAINPDPCDEFITAPITDMGTIIPILAQNCLPVFADIDPRTYNVSPASIRERLTERTRGIIVVHLFGNPCDMDPIMEIARAHNLYVIEDCSQAYGTMYKGRRCGTIGHFGCFSLQASKHITTGDGGLTITNDDELGERARLFADKGWPRYSAEGARNYLFFGFNYHMTELTAAVGLAQLPKLDRICAARHWAGERLTEQLQDLPGIVPPLTQPGGLHTYWSYPLRLDEEKLGWTKEEFAEAVRAEGAPISTGYIGYPIFMYEYIRRQHIYGRSQCPFDCPKYGSGHIIRYEEGYCPEAERALQQMANLHVNEFFTEQDVDDLAHIVRKVALSSK